VSDREERLNALVAAYLKSIETGEPVSRQEWLDHHPDLASGLALFFADLDQFEELAAPLRSISGAASTLNAARDPSMPGRGTAEPPADAPRFSFNYEVLAVLAVGGMGVVYKARQNPPDRLVALKTIRASRLASPADVQRFRNEAEMVASLDHPHIVPIYEVVSSADGLFFSMKLMEGGSAAEHLGRYATDPRAAVRLLVPIARAVHHANQRGVLHRDLKPSNILLDREGQPHLTDFGLARRLQGPAIAGTEESLTLTGVIIGTSGYMAPEQAAGRKGAVTIATDVYGLGALLYALLTGRPPFAAGSVLETLEQVRTCVPQPPRRLNRRVDRDLETICLKCLDKEPVRRYDSAEAVARELERWLAGEPIHARAIGRSKQALRWCRRNPVVAALGGLSLAALVATTTISLIWAFREREIARQQTEAAEELKQSRQQIASSLATSEALRRESELQTTALTLERALTLCERGETTAGLLWLARSLSLLPRDADDLDWCIRANLAGWSNELHPLRAVLECPGPVLGVAFQPDGRSFWTATGGHAVERWAADSFARLGSPVARDLHAGALSPEGNYLLIVSGETKQFWKHPGGFTNDGIREALGGSGQLYETVTRNAVGSPLSPPGNILSVAFSPDGRTACTGCRDGTARIWQVPTGEALGTTVAMAGEVWAVAFSPDGLVLATGNNAGTVQLWDVPAGRPLGAPWSLPAPYYVWSLAFSPDGQRVVAGTSDYEYRVWSRATGKVLLANRQRGGVYRAVFSTDARTILSASDDRTARICEAETGRQIGPALGHEGIVQTAAFSPDGRFLLTGGWDKTARLWEKAPGNSLPTLLRNSEVIVAGALSWDGQTLLTADGTQAQLRHTITGRAIGKRFGHPFPIVDVGLSLDGRWALIVSAGQQRSAQFWDLALGKPHGPLVHAVPNAGMGPDGRLLVGADGKSMQLWDPASCRFVGKRLDKNAAAYSRDGGTFVSMRDTQGMVTLCKSSTGQLVGRPVHFPRAGPLAVAPGGKSFWARTEGMVHLINVETGVVVDRPLRQGDARGKTVFSPDGRVFITAYGDGMARFWDPFTGWPLGPAVGPIDSVVMAFRGDSRVLWTTTPDHRSGTLWQVPAPLEGKVERLVLWTQVIAGAELDPAGVIHVLDGSTWKARRKRLEELGGAPNIPHCLSEVQATSMGK
jgi:WD40 repeat protein/tRNA A-37 threonylcarbamoyl transferase component Bud32